MMWCSQMRDGVPTRVAGNTPRIGNHLILSTFSGGVLGVVFGVFFRRLFSGCRLVSLERSLRLLRRVAVLRTCLTNRRTVASVLWCMVCGVETTEGRT